MHRFIVIILIVSTLVACGSAPAEPLTAEAPAADQQTAVPAVVTATATAAPSVTARPLEPTATYVPTPTAAPTTVPTHTPLPTAVPTTAPAATSQPPTRTTTTDAMSVDGTLNIDAQRPIPPDAVLSIQLRRVNQDGLGFFNVLDEEQLPIDAPKPVAFNLTYRGADIAPPPDGGLPYVYHVYAELRAPGRITWWVESDPLDLQQPPAPVTVTLKPPANIVEINGTLTIPDQPALPPDAVLTVRLASQNGYRSFEPHKGELVVTPVKPGKQPFILEYMMPPTEEQQETYVIHAEVRAGAKLPLISPRVPAITQGQTGTVDVVLSPPQEIASITGTISYTARQALPADALLTIQIQDVSGADGPAYVLASYTMKPVGSSPIPFAIEYDPALIDQRSDYALSAQITAGEKLLFFDDIRRSVITQGDSKPVEIVLKAIN